MNEITILNSIRDAKDCIRNRRYNGSLLFSTHPSVDTYLKEFYGVNCQCLSKVLVNDEVMRYKSVSSQAVDNILNELDQKIAPSINRQFGLNMRYFVPIYCYLGKYQFSGYLCFIEAIRKIIDIYKIKKISFYDYNFNMFFKVSTNMGQLAKVFLNNLETQVINPAQAKTVKDVDFEHLHNIIKKLRHASFEKIKRKLNRKIDNISYRRFLNAKKTILLYEYLYELDFLKKQLTGFNVIYYNYNDYAPAGFLDDGRSSVKINADFGIADLLENKNSPFAGIFISDIMEDFRKNITGYINGINLLRGINRKHPISLGIWGNTPPMSGLKSLVFEYLKSENIKIVGAQHGGVYGDSLVPWHFDSDFNNCDYFISYGFTKADLRRLYPKSKIDCQIMPFGKVKSVQKKALKNKIDVLFPLTMNSSMFEGGMVRINPDKLKERQITLLKYLNSLESLSIYIKPVAYPTYQNCSALPVLKRLKNLRIIDTSTLSEFLRWHEPRAVLLEFASTPLYECLFLDTEVFLMNDDLHPYEDQVFKELQKRVHYSEDTSEIIKMMDLFLKGKLEKKRDATFFKHYVYKDSAKKNILQFIHSLAGA